MYAVSYRDLVGSHYEEFKLDNRTYKIGDVVGLIPSLEHEPPFVCRIEKIYLPPHSFVFGAVCIVNIFSLEVLQKIGNLPNKKVKVLRSRVTANKT